MNEQEFKRFKSLYDNATKYGKSSFTFDGQEVLTSYARYLIEYLSTKFPSKS